MAKFLNHFVSRDHEDVFGVVLVNLGTPESPSSSSVRRFLREFLSDTRVVELPKPIWWLILNGIIRPAKSATAYREIWTDEGSPLLLNSMNQAEKLADRLRQAGINNAEVRSAMRYGEPSLRTVIAEFGSLGIDRLLFIPMYPQYSGSTCGSVFDEVANVMRRLRRVPSVRFINNYAQDDAYIRALQATVRAHWATSGQAQKLVMSFHGVPEQFRDNGDPYYDQCKASANRLASALNLTEDQWTMCFQSRVGRQIWLQPYTEDVMKQLPQQGVTCIDVICPGFSVDCLETLEEVNIGYRQLYFDSGGQAFNYITCLNDRPEHIEMLEQMVSRSVSDWIQSSADPV